MAKHKENYVEEFEEESLVNKGEQFVEDNKKTLSGIIIIIILIVASFFAYKKLYLPGVEDEANKQMYMAQKYFEIDSFNTAINGDGNIDGFLNIIEDYGVTKSANLSHFYAGVSYMGLGNFDKAIEHLEAFSSNDKILAQEAVGMIGDAYLEKKEMDKALTYYLKAATVKNDMTSPYFYKKAGFVYELKSDFKSALEYYEKIKKEYPKSEEAKLADKRITQAKLKL